ncbi:MAG: redoxin domain-containing protein [Myxococcales bacterium]|nr:redoxin domain-containing protein [Myxococcales bacterium]
MREQYPMFRELGCEVLNLGPDSAKKFQSFWAEQAMPFPGLADPDHRVAKLYDQQVRLLKLGRMPLQLLVSRDGVVRYRHDSNSMSDIPPVAEVLEVVRKLRG